MGKIGSFANSFSIFLRGDDATSSASDQPPSNADPLAPAFAEIDRLKRLFFRSPDREKVKLLTSLPTVHLLLSYYS